MALIRFTISDLEKECVACGGSGHYDGLNSNKTMKEFTCYLCGYKWFVGLLESEKKMITYAKFEDI